MKLFIGQLLPLATAKEVATGAPKIIATTIGGRSMAIDLARCYQKESSARLDLAKCNAVTNDFCLVCIPNIGTPFILPEPLPEHEPLSRWDDRTDGIVLPQAMSESDGVIYLPKSVVVTRKGVSTSYPKLKEAAMKHEAAVKLSRQQAASAKVTGKQSLARGGIYSPTGETVKVCTKSGKWKKMPANIASQPTYSRNSSPSKYDQRTENRNFNKVAAVAWDDTGASGKTKRKREEFRTVIEAANAVLQSIK